MNPVFVADIISSDWTQPLLNTGFMGIALVWLATRAEARMKEHDRRMVAIESASNRATRAILLLVVSLRTANDAAKQEARGILREINPSDDSPEQE